MNNSIQFTTRMAGRSSYTADRKKITKIERFNFIINELKGKKLNGSDLLKLFSNASASKFESSSNISEDTFEHLKELAKNSSNFFIKDFTASFVKVLSIAYISSKGVNGFIKDNKGVLRLDPDDFKKWLSDNSNIKSNQIPDKYFYDITMDQSTEEITFGDKNYKNSKLKISDIAETPESQAVEILENTPIAGGTLEISKDNETPESQSLEISEAPRLDIKAEKPKQEVLLPEEPKHMSEISYSEGTYEGHISNGKRHGFGTFLYNGKHSGKKFIGNWKEDRLHGNGQFIIEGFGTYESIWENGIDVGPAIYKDEYGRRKEASTNVPINNETKNKPSDNTRKQSLGPNETRYRNQKNQENTDKTNEKTKQVKGAETESRTREKRKPGLPPEVFKKSHKSNLIVKHGILTKEASTDVSINNGTNNKPSDKTVKHDTRKQSLGPNETRNRNQKNQENTNKTNEKIKQVKGAETESRTREKRKPGLPPEVFKKFHANQI